MSWTAHDRRDVWERLVKQREFEAKEQERLLGKKR